MATATRCSLTSPVTKTVLSLNSPAAALALLKMVAEIDVPSPSGGPRAKFGNQSYLRSGRANRLGAMDGAADSRGKIGRVTGPDHIATDEVADVIEEFLTGARSAAEPDRVLATVMFNDIVASTERAATVGDRRWRELLENYRRTVRGELTRHRGREVNTAGDGFLVTFDGPARAIRCACAIRDAVRSHGIQVRAGLHTGECEPLGDDVGGIAVHIGARVISAAGPDEVVVSSTVKDLVVASGIHFDDRGTHVLKGVPGEWRLFAVQ